MNLWILHESKHVFSKALGIGLSQTYTRGPDTKLLQQLPHSLQNILRGETVQPSKNIAAQQKCKIWEKISFSRCFNEAGTQETLKTINRLNIVKKEKAKPNKETALPPKNISEMTAGLLES